MSEPSPASQALGSVLEQYWRRKVDRDPFLSLRLGMRVAQLPDVSFEHVEREAEFARPLLSELASIRLDELGHDDRLTLQVLQRDLEVDVKAPQVFWHHFQVAPFQSPIPLFEEVLSRLPLETDDQLDEYLDLVDQWPAFIDKITANIKEQRRRRILIPQEELRLITPYLASFLREFEQHSFWVADERLSAVDRRRRERFQSRLAHAIRDRVRPPFGKLLETIGREYFAAAPEKVGLHQYPDGESVYQLMIRRYTSLDLAPEDIHRIGLDEVGRLEEKVIDATRRMGLRADSLPAAFEQLQAHPRTYVSTREEIGVRLAGYMQRADEALPRYFLRLPATPCRIEPLPPERGLAETFGLYREPTAAAPFGCYYYNSSAPRQTPLLSAADLIYHELMPGHHMQIARQAEAPDLHPYRRNCYVDIFGDGWAEYAASFAEEMGLYDDPFDYCGRMVQEIFMAARLVVDTGMNGFGWSLGRAADFLRGHIFESEAHIHSECLRYACDMPAQSLIYSLGFQAMKRLRARAEQALSGAFDIKRFHETILVHGSLPMTALESHVEWFIEQEHTPRSDSGR
jgi:uncharacterized protein (DUF885 family)